MAAKVARLETKMNLIAYVTGGTFVVAIAELIRVMFH
jgi:hypothetical protein